MTRPVVAIVGSGPSAYYTAEELLKRDVRVDLIERLPTPFGLVRGGVAPDHPKIKSISALFEKISTHPNLGFYGNVCVGSEITVPELHKFYDAVVLACGASADVPLGILGENLPGSCSAGAFVGWYNGHPDYRDHTFPLDRQRAVIIGHGNVALDVARILLTPVDLLRKTDIAEHALEALSRSAISEIYLIGRRGPAQSNFTPHELKEVINLAGCQSHVSGGDLSLDLECQAELADKSADYRRQNVNLLRELASRAQAESKRNLHISFRLSPLAVIGSERVEGVRFVRNRLDGIAGSRAARPTDEVVIIDCDFLIRSIGFRGIPIAGVPFDAKSGTVPNRCGRIVQEGNVVSGLYVAGWMKRGSNGVIGTNRACEVETARAVIEDLTHQSTARLNTQEFEQLLSDRKIEFIRYEGWRRIDALETGRGQAKGKPREKFTRLQEMMTASRPAASKPDADPRNVEHAFQ